MESYSGEVNTRAVTGTLEKATQQENFTDKNFGKNVLMRNSCTDKNSGKLHVYLANLLSC